MALKNGKDQSSFHQTLRCAQGDRWGEDAIRLILRPVSLALSREGGRDQFRDHSYHLRRWPSEGLIASL